MNLGITTSRARIGRRRIVWMEEVGSEHPIRSQLEVLQQASLFCRIFGNSVKLIYQEGDIEQHITLKEWHHDAQRLATHDGKEIPLTAIRYIYIV